LWRQLEHHFEPVDDLRTDLSDCEMQLREFFGHVFGDAALAHAFKLNDDHRDFLRAAGQRAYVSSATPGQPVVTLNDATAIARCTARLGEPWLREARQPARREPWAHIGSEGNRQYAFINTDGVVALFKDSHPWDARAASQTYTSFSAWLEHLTLRLRRRGKRGVTSSAADRALDSNRRRLLGVTTSATLAEVWPTYDED
jgi:hypothetical protein